MSDRTYLCPQCRREVTALHPTWTTPRHCVLLCEDCAARSKARAAAEEQFETVSAAKVLPFTPQSTSLH